MNPRIETVIRINTIAGAVMLGLVVLTVVLIVSGMLPWDTRVAINLVIGAVLASLMLLTARSARQDRDDPAGIERRFESGAVAWSAALLVAGFAAVIGVIAWGLLR